MWIRLGVVLSFMMVFVSGCVEGDPGDSSESGGGPENCLSLRDNPVAIADMHGVSFGYPQAQTIAVDPFSGRIAVPYRQEGGVGYELALWDGQDWALQTATPGEYVGSNEYFEVSGFKLASLGGLFHAAFSGQLLTEESGSDKVYEEVPGLGLGAPQSLGVGPQTYANQLLESSELRDRLILITNSTDNGQDLDCLLYTSPSPRD